MNYATQDIMKDLIKCLSLFNGSLSRRYLDRDVDGLELEVDDFKRELNDLLSELMDSLKSINLEIEEEE